MPRTILSVAFPLTPVGPDAVGGSEQIVAQLDAALTAAGHRSIVIAAEGSQTFGELVPTPGWDGPLNDEVRYWAQQQHCIAIEQTLEREAIDLIHMHGLDWHTYLPAPALPTLATLHLPCDWYSESVLHMRRRRTYVNCVSRSQREQCRFTHLPIFTVENGVPVDQLQSRGHKRGYAMALGRICPEKGLHLAIEAASRADMPLILAGETFPYRTHVEYYEQKVRPRLSDRTRFIGPVGFARKRRLLTGAQCLLVPSRVAETSSLVSMEALACGTPVIAFASGALQEVVEHGRTGFVVHDVDEMAAAIRRMGEIDPQECRLAARERFSSHRMACDYMSLYEDLLSGSFDEPRPSTEVQQPITPGSH